MTAQLEFLRSEFRTLSFMGASQRVSIYAADTGESERCAFREALRTKLESFAQPYLQTEVSEDEHVDNIRRFADELSSQFPGTLDRARFRIGPSQKALNLYLKYLWCAGLSQRPPHCPVDAIVLREAGDAVMRWSIMDSVDEYRKAIGILRAAATKAGFTSLAEWELEAWANGKAKAMQGVPRSTPSRHAFAAPHTA